MDDDEVGREQARGLARALDAADLAVGALWLHYFRLGGEVQEVEIDAYLHHALRLPRLERDLLAHAANELVDHGSGTRAPYSSEVPADDPDETARGTEGTEGTDGDGGPGGAQH
ncbi:hypothetical protein [Kocuria rosea]|jgi:hypothetical protein|uniref:hypothetical protein n=1 Tax=Kocuria rosea TaxID=1275 RepID=UPI00203D9E13|nr:hypothetical protein [Kocuria rosea]MCM3687316.1 hypothetical protein [Kocuria rosea]